MEAAVRVVVVEDHLLLRESLELALLAAGFVVPPLSRPTAPVPLASTIAEVTGLRPRIALVDIDPSRYGDGLRLVLPLVRNGIVVVAMTSSSTRSHWGEAVRLGAATVHSRSRPLVDIITTVRRLASDEPVMTRRERDELVGEGDEEQVDRREVLARLEGLTPREAAVLGELLDGRPVREIADRSGVSQATVRSQVTSILAKLGVSTQLAAVGRAHEVGWRPPTT